MHVCKHNVSINMATQRVRDDEIEGLLGDNDVNFSDSDSEFEPSDIENRAEVENNSESSDDDVLSDTSERNDAPNILNDGWNIYRDSDVDFKRIAFTGMSGYKAPIGNKPKTELEFFQLFMTDELLTEIVKETNRYAKVNIQKVTPLKQESTWKSWFDVTLPEFKAFLGVLLNMSMNCKAELQDYFSEEWIDKCPFYKDVFTRKRFLQIFWMLHICPPPTQQVQGVRVRGLKIQNLVDYLDTKFREFFVPGQNISIDESTVGFKGRIQFKCYNPLKPTKWGIRIFVLADSSTGFIVALEPYYGAATTSSLSRPNLPFTARIVLHLCDKLSISTNGSKGFHVFTDRYYTGYELAMELLKLGYHLTGTVMLNRKGLPPSTKKKNAIKLAKHEVRAYRKDDCVLVLLWKDKRTVSMLSTYHNSSNQVVVRNAKGKEREIVTKPTVVCEYNKHMGGVDLADHLLSSYSFTRRSVKWWRKMFFWLLEVAVTNSFILYNTQNRPVKHRQYRRELVKQLVGDVRNKESRKRGRPSSSDKEERLNCRPHFIYANQQSKSKDCAVCSDRKVKGGRKETVYFCNTCTKKPGLHPGECFEKFHTLKKYR